MTAAKILFSLSIGMQQTVKGTNKHIRSNIPLVNDRELSHHWSNSRAQRSLGLFLRIAPPKRKQFLPPTTKFNSLVLFQVALAPLSVFPFSPHAAPPTFISTMDMMFYMKKNKEKDAVKKSERQQRDELKNVVITGTFRSLRQ